MALRKVVRISVNAHTVRANKKHGKDDPPIRISRGRKVTYAREVKVGEGRFVYSPEKPLSCGARLWFECDGEVEVVA